MKAKYGDPLAPFLIVLLNGVPCKHCIEADEVSGNGVRYKSDDRGFVIVNCNNVETEVFNGNVRFEIKPDAPLWAHQEFEKIRLQEAQ